MSPRTAIQNEALREQNRQLIRDSAFELFAQNGYENTTISAIAKKAGVSKGLIYHYFNSKENILEQIYKYWVNATEYMLHAEEEISPDERMKKMLDDVFNFIEQKPEIGRFMTSLAIQPSVIAAIKPYLDKVKNRQIGFIAALLAELNYKNPEEEAYYLGAKLDGITLGYITLGEEYPFEKMKSKIFNEYVH